MKIKQIAQQLEKIAPLGMALDWDNVGFLVGDSRRDVKRILLTIDVTRNVIVEAKKLKIDLIISYHPIIWDGLKTVTADGPGQYVYELIRSNIAVFSIHTALDIVPGGVNDALADIVGIKDGQPIGDYVTDPAGNNYKLVVFAPRNALAKVSNAIFQAGAGWIGNYSHCGFTAEGEGSFLPLEGSNPAIGKKGKLEKVEEVRFETIVPAAKLADCINAMKKAHPYEEPAFDCFKLCDNQNMLGLGRIGELEKSAQLSDIIKKIKTRTGARLSEWLGVKKDW
jgi:dinuclear metal center YbgI/SA1388 family protein